MENRIVSLLLKGYLCLKQMGQKQSSDQ